MNLLTSSLRSFFLPISCVASHFLSDKTLSFAQEVDERVNQLAVTRLQENKIAHSSSDLFEYTGFIAHECCCGLPLSFCSFFPFLKNSEERKRDLELAKAKEYFVKYQRMLNNSAYPEYTQRILKILEELIKTGYIDNNILNILLSNATYKEFLFPVLESMLNNHLVTPETLKILSSDISHDEGYRNDTIRAPLARMQLKMLTELHQSGLDEKELLDLISSRIDLLYLNGDLKLGMKNITRNLIQSVLTKNMTNQEVLSMLFSPRIKQYVRQEDFQNIIYNMIQRNVVTIQTLISACQAELPDQVKCDIVDNILKNKALTKEHPKILEVIPYGLPNHYLYRIIESAIINKTISNSLFEIAIKNKYPEDLIFTIIECLLQWGKVDETTLRIGSSFGCNFGPNIIGKLLYSKEKLNDYVLQEAINYNMTTEVLVYIINSMIQYNKITPDTFEISVKKNLPREVIQCLLNQLIENRLSYLSRAESLNILDNALKSNVISSDTIAYIVDEIIKSEFCENTVLAYLLYYGHHEQIDRVVKKMEENNRMDPLSWIIYQSSQTIR